MSRAGEPGAQRLTVGALATAIAVSGLLGTVTVLNPGGKVGGSISVTATAGNRPAPTDGGTPDLLRPPASAAQAAPASRPPATQRSPARPARQTIEAAAGPARRVAPGHHETLRRAAAPTGPLWGPGYRLAAADGGVFSFGNARYFGSMGHTQLGAPVVGMASTPDGLGYWVASADGGVFSFGDARYLGGLVGRHLGAPVVGMAATPDGGGYWLVAADGGVFSFGTARFYGSLVGRRLNQPIVGMATMPDGTGYWLVSADGGVFSFGTAPYLGSWTGHPLNRSVVGMAATPDGTGYWLVSADGGVFTYGTARFYGGLGGASLAAPIVGIAASPTGAGYWLASADGGVFTYGDAGFWGAPGGFVTLHQPVTAVAAGLDPAYHSTQFEVGGRYGFDVSWPQCNDSSLPAGHAFAVLGVTGGKAFTTNPCLGSQWTWATGASGAAGLYINLNQPDPGGPRSETGPAGSCPPGNLDCAAYNYGANAVDAAVAYAHAAGVDAPMWWLDVETANAWTPSQTVNALVVRGAIDELQYRQLKVGIYSTPAQWNQITGSVSFFVPVWVAGSPDMSGATSFCGHGFNGGPVWMVQTMLDYDVDYLCGGLNPSVAFGIHPLPSAPTYPLGPPPGSSPSGPRS